MRSSVRLERVEKMQALMESDNQEELATYMQDIIKALQ